MYNTKRIKRNELPAPPISLGPLHPILAMKNKHSLSRANLKTLIIALMFALSTLTFASIQASAQAQERDERTWHNPTRTQSLTFSTPQDYIACPEPGTTDAIIASDIPQGWRLRGEVVMTYLDGDARIEVPNGRYQVDFTSAQPNDTFTFDVEYPPVDEWHRNSSNYRGVYVDIAIEVTNENDIIIDWVGGDPINSPGTLGPGGQDWGINCLFPAPPTYLPFISR